MKSFNHVARVLRSERVQDVLSTHWHSVINVHGAAGLGAWLFILEKAASNGNAAIFTDEAWLKETANLLKINRWNDLEWMLDTLGSIGLIDPNLWVTLRAIKVNLEDAPSPYEFLRGLGEE